MAGQSPLRRWKPFFAAFGLVDAAIEAGGGPAISRDEFRSARAEVMELLCDVPADGGGEAEARAEEICFLLDSFMAESLVTLRSVPADAVPRVLASSADLAGAVGALRCHESERVRGLASDVVRRWRQSVANDMAMASAAMHKLDDLSSQRLPSESLAFHSHVPDGRGYKVPSDRDADAMMKWQAKIQESHRYPKKTAPVVAGPGLAKAVGASDPLPKQPTPAATISRARTTNTEASRNISESSLPNKTPPPVARRAAAGDDDRVTRCSLEEKMEATKRKLREGYEEAADAKRRRKIKVIEAPKMLEQRQRRMHPIMRERSRARCGGSTAVRRSLISISSFQRV